MMESRASAWACVATAAVASAAASINLLNSIPGSPRLRRMRAIVEWQQQQLQMRRRPVVPRRGDAGNRRQHFLCDVSDDVLDLAAAVRREQRGEARILQVVAEQGADPRSGDAKRVAGIV